MNAELHINIKKHIHS